MYIEIDFKHEILMKTMNDKKSTKLPNLNNDNFFNIWDSALSLLINLFQNLHNKYVFYKYTNILDTNRRVTI